MDGYFIGYAAQGTTNWAQFTMLTEATAGTEMSNANVPPGAWVFGIRAIDIADQLEYGIDHSNKRNRLYDLEKIPFAYKDVRENSLINGN